MATENQDGMDVLDRAADSMNPPVQEEQGQETTENQEETVEETVAESGQEAVAEEQEESGDSETSEETEEEDEEEIDEEESEDEEADDEYLELSEDEALDIFYELTGLDLESIDQVDEYKKVLGNWSEYKKNIELYPTLIEKLKSSQDVMQHFPDEVTYKVAQLAKDEKYRDKKPELTKILESDISSMEALDVVRLYAGLNAPAGVRNPLRYMIKQTGLDPDEVIDNFNELNDDDKDLFMGLTSRAKKELSSIGSDIEVPKSSVDDIEAMLKEQSDSLREDLEKRRSEINPLLSAVVDEVSELEVDDDFSFKLEMTKGEKNNYADFLTEALLSGEFNVSTEEGIQELYDALMDEIWVDNRQKVLEAYGTSLRKKLEEEFRAKINNEVPLDKKTPPPEKEKTEQTIIGQTVQEMIAERQ